VIIPVVYLTGRTHSASGGGGGGPAISPDGAPIFDRSFTAEFYRMEELIIGYREEDGSAVYGPHKQTTERSGSESDWDTTRQQMVSEGWSLEPGQPKWIQTVVGYEEGSVEIVETPASAFDFIGAPRGGDPGSDTLATLASAAEVASDYTLERRWRHPHRMDEMKFHNHPWYFWDYLAHGESERGVWANAHACWWGLYPGASWKEIWFQSTLIMPPGHSERRVFLVNASQKSSPVGSGATIGLGVATFRLQPGSQLGSVEFNPGTLPAGWFSSNGNALALTPPTEIGKWNDIGLSVLLDLAPDVLRVNADFDEQKLDAATTFAKADCDDEDLIAAIGPDAGKVIIQDLHQGFFGLNPNTLPADFYSGATVTIEKLAEIDPETSQPELGEVRFYATKNLGATGELFWPIPITEPAGDGGGGTTPKNLVPVIYAPNATVPRGTDVQYWMEGIKAGPITLEFKYVKGSVTFSHKQKFLVATHQSKTDWQNEIIQQVKLQTRAKGTVDLSLYNRPWPAAPFMTKKAYIQEVYAYYEYLYLQKPHLFLWAGLAKMAGGPAYAAMNDAEHGRTASYVGGVAGPLVGQVTADFFQINLMRGNYDIFNDLAWQFRAYQASGIWALRHVKAKALDSPGRPIVLSPWNDMWQGDYSGSAALVRSANLSLTDREQRFIVQDAWNDFAVVPGIEHLLGPLAQSPLKVAVPGADSFSSVVGTGDITSFPDRWRWVTHSTNGIWQDWTGLSTTARTGMVTIPLRTRVEEFSLFHIYSLRLIPIIW